MRKERETMVRERPIIFSGEMVKAILDGRKTQTRRVVKPRFGGKIIGWGGQGVAMESVGIMDGCENIKINLCPYGMPGDRLWVRETFQAWKDFDKTQTVDLPQEMRERLNYPADGNIWDSRIRTSIHMPRWASRILLEITDIRVQLLQNINEDDAVAEGYEGGCHVMQGYAYAYRSTPLEHFLNLWISIHGADSWERNDFVWAVEFKRIEGP